MESIKKYLFQFYEWLQSEPDYKHPKLNLLPNFVINLTGLLLLIIIFLKLVFYLVSLL